MLLLVWTRAPTGISSGHTARNRPRERGKEETGTSHTARRQRNTQRRIGMFRLGRHARGVGGSASCSGSRLTPAPPTVGRFLASRINNSAATRRSVPDARNITNQSTRAQRFSHSVVVCRTTPSASSSSLTLPVLCPLTLTHTAAATHPIAIARIHQHATRMAEPPSNTSSTPSPVDAASASTVSEDPAAAAKKPKRRTIKTLRYDLLQYLSTHFPAIREWCNLIKIELSFVVTTSSFFGCLLAGSDAWSTPHVLANFAGTAMCAASAAIINQYLERPYDAQMKRTSQRPLVTGTITVAQALTAAALLPVGGAALLHYASAGDWVAPTLGLATIFGYTCIYTPMKRMHRWNTEVGAIIGSVPVLIGWSCAISHWSHHMATMHHLHLPFTTLQSLAMPHALYGFFLLVAWQMQHFMTIASQYEDQYAKAGYVMMRGNSAIRKGIAWTGILCAMPFVGVYYGVASNMFLITSSAINGLLVLSYGKWYRASKSTTDQVVINRFARSCMLWGIVYFFLMFGATVFHSLDNKYHLITTFVPTSIRQAGYALCPWRPTSQPLAPQVAAETFPTELVQEPCTHQHAQNDRSCIYMRLVKPATLEALEHKDKQQPQQAQTPN